MTIEGAGYQALNSHHWAIWVPSVATAFCTAGRASMRLRCSMTRGSLVVSTPSPSIQVPIVNRYGSQMVYCSPMTHGPFKSLRSISSKHSVVVAGTLRFIASIAAASSAQRAPPPAMRVRDVNGRAEIAVKLLHLRQGERIRERREFSLRKTLRHEEQQSGSFGECPAFGHQRGNPPFWV